MRRSGVTIVEVLMGVLILGVGATAVFALFPLSMAKSIRAHQFTMARGMADNTREHIRTQPRLLAPPTPGLNFRGEWTPNTVYAVNDAVIPAHRPGQILPQPFVVFTAAAVTGTGASGPTEPSWPVTLPATVADSFAGNGVQWIALPQTPFVVDPLGIANVSLPGLASVFGNRVSVNPGFVSPLARAQSAAGTVFTDPDSWDVYYEAVPVAPFVASEVTFGPDFNNNNMPSGSVIRIPIQGGGVFSSPVSTNLNPRKVSVVNPFPVGTLDNYRPMRLEVARQDMTCFLAVHPNGPDAAPSVQCAAVFRRSFGVDDEYVYDANFGNAAYNAVARVDGVGLQPDQVRLAWTNTGASREPTPLMKEGGYLFDVRQARFYRISDVGPQSVAGADTSVVLTLTETVREPTAGLAADVGQVMLIRGIVHVFDLTW